MGSGRSHGNTRIACDVLTQQFGWHFHDLLDYQIAPYDYEHRNQADDFLPLVRQMIAQSDHWILATPIYWYSMSAQLKVFVDRLTDLMDLYPEDLAALKGKRLSVLINCSTPALPEGFLVPFFETAKYLDMEVGRHHHSQIRELTLTEEHQVKLEAFGKWVEGQQ